MAWIRPLSMRKSGEEDHNGINLKEAAMWNTEKKSISPKELEKFLQELQEWVSQEVRETEQKAHDRSAPQSYCDDMSGCARGKSIIGNQLISKIKKHYLED